SPSIPRSLDQKASLKKGSVTAESHERPKTIDRRTKAIDRRVGGCGCLCAWSSRPRVAVPEQVKMIYSVKNYVPTNTAHLKQQQYSVSTFPGLCSQAARLD